ncbi:hypothetical protein HMPREF2829_01130 [Aerococcus sp. HMSC072A12]|nr:hypothetical protein HMPREF2829_01130 [Aerococcus sp. HMSC072A12]OFR32884.1 hypothetical protein HMPREF2892_07775 [Aerococcus sp. HMSC061A03]OFT40548.1 hypothetical protein HMPREF3161_04745 [Aerococcus sp. HMSC06H08]
MKELVGSFFILPSIFAFNRDQILNLGAFLIEKALNFFISFKFYQEMAFFIILWSLSVIIKLA